MCRILTLWYSNRVGEGHSSYRNAATGEPERVLGGYSHWVMCVAFSPDGRHVVSGSTVTQPGSGMR